MILPNTEEYKARKNTISCSLLQICSNIVFCDILRKHRKDEKSLARLVNCSNIA